MIIKNVELLITAGNKSQYPITEYPEIAFGGRSNVGKSSLLNVLINRKKYAKTSAQPGKTQTINFYAVNENQMLVDLPGYGYAKVSKREREKWSKMIEEFLVAREQLRGFMLLIDIRHIPTQNDIDMYNRIKNFGFDPYVIATKADKVSKGKRFKQISDIKKTLGVEDINRIIPFSAVDRLNRELIWGKINELSGE